MNSGDWQRRREDELGVSWKKQWQVVTINLAGLQEWYHADPAFEALCRWRLEETGQHVVELQDPQQTFRARKRRQEEEWSRL